MAKTNRNVLREVAGVAPYGGEISMSGEMFERSRLARERNNAAWGQSPNIPMSPSPVTQGGGAANAGGGGLPPSAPAGGANPYQQQAEDRSAYLNQVAAQNRARQEKDRRTTSGVMTVTTADGHVIKVTNAEMKEKGPKYQEAVNAARVAHPMTATATGESAGFNQGSVPQMTMPSGNPASPNMVNPAYAGGAQQMQGAIATLRAKYADDLRKVRGIPTDSEQQAIQTAQLMKNPVTARQILANQGAMGVAGLRERGATERNSASLASRENINKDTLAARGVEGDKTRATQTDINKARNEKDVEISKAKIAADTAKWGAETAARLHEVDTRFKTGENKLAADAAKAKIDGDNSAAKAKLEQYKALAGVYRSLAPNFADDPNSVKLAEKVYGAMTALESGFNQDAVADMPPDRNPSGSMAAPQATQQPVAAQPQGGQYQVGQVIPKGGKSWRVTGFDKDGMPLVEAM